MERILRNRVGASKFFYFSAHKSALLLLIMFKAFFNSMLKDFGVGGVKVQEVISLDDEMLMLLP